MIREGREGVKDVQTKKASINQLFSKDKLYMFPWSKETNTHCDNRVFQEYLCSVEIA